MPLLTPAAGSQKGSAAVPLNVVGPPPGPPPTIPAVLFLGRNVLPSCQHRSQRNTAKGPLRREVGRLKPTGTNHPWDQTASVGLRPHYSLRPPSSRDEVPSVVLDPQPIARPSYVR